VLFYSGNLAVSFMAGRKWQTTSKEIKVNIICLLSLPSYVCLANVRDKWFENRKKLILCQADVRAAAGSEEILFHLLLETKILVWIPVFQNFFFYHSL
jgi:hypothetical protein